MSKMTVRLKELPSKSVLLSTLVHFLYAFVITIQSPATSLHLKRMLCLCFSDRVSVVCYHLF